MIADPDLQNRVIVEHLQRALGDLVAVYRFGSTAQGMAVDTSDVDIAVLPRTALAPGQRFDLQEQIAGAIGHDLDLVDLSSASTVMAVQVIAGGHLIFDGDSNERGRFEDLALGSYARLNEERREILKRIAIEGTVYGR